MINLTVLKHAVPVASKSTLILTDLIQSDYQQDLIEQFPKLPFVEVKREANIDRKHTFKFLSSQAFNSTNISNGMFSPAWLRFINAITHSEYLNKLSELINFDLSKTRWAFELGQYRSGDWKEAHYDQQKDKILTQLFYFSNFWDVTWGGHFHILQPDDLTASVLTIPPTINYSVITLAKPDAWHKVGKMQPHATQSRLVMGLQFYCDPITTASCYC